MTPLIAGQLIQWVGCLTSIGLTVLSVFLSSDRRETP